jgi:hypothetical protein
VENNIKGGALGSTILKRRGNYLLDYWGKKIIPISRNWRKLSFYYFYPNLPELEENSPNNCHLLAILFIYIIIFATFWQLWGEKCPDIDE